MDTEDEDNGAGVVGIVGVVAVAIAVAVAATVSMVSKSVVSLEHTITPSKLDQKVS